MLFNSYEFIFLFLPITLFIFYCFTHFGNMRAATWWLGLASLVFYAYWDWHFLMLFVGSIAFNYSVGKRITTLQAHKQKRYLLLFGLSVNLGLLAYFKYTHFFLSNYLALTGFTMSIPEVVLPVGISFFTFTQIAFLVDCERSRQHQYHFSDYVLFVSFFPHLVAGPILLHNATIPQFENKRFGKPSARKIYMAMLFFSIGLFKKVIIADNLASFVDPIFAHANQLSTYDAWTGAVLYTFQIYFDFSAYSEMAVGLALLMNVRIPLNFNSPYKSLSIIDFWRRWHISLSRFLRDYLYIPLGGNRRGGIRRYLNLFATMLLGGLWHGAAWTFVVWGGLHGIYLAINHAWRKTGVKLPRYFAWAITFFAVMMAWVFFRAQSLTDANALVRSMFGFDQASSLPSQIQATPIMLLLCVSMLIGWAIVAPNAQQIIISRQPKLRYSLIIPLMLVIGMLALGRNYSFIYFQF